MTHVHRPLLVVNRNKDEQERGRITRPTDLGLINPSLFVTNACTVSG